MYCVNCGTEMPDDAKFCGTCGQEVAAPVIHSQGEANSTQKQSFPGWVGVLLVALVALGIGAGVLFSMRGSDSPETGQDSMQPVAMNIIAPNYNGETDSKIKANISGTTKAGAQVNRTVFISPASPTFEIEQGSYTVQIVASPLLESGDFYAVPEPVSLVVGKADAAEETADVDNANNELDIEGGVQASEVQTIEFEVIPPDQVTQEQIDAARAAAIEGGFDEAKANELAEVLAEKREAAAFDPIEAYLPVLQAYKTAMESDEVPNDPYVNIEAWTAAQQWVDRPLMYALVDLAENGQPVLAIAYKFDSAGNGSGTSGTMASYRIYDLFGLQDGSPTRLVELASLGYRRTEVLYEGGFVGETGSGGAFDGSQTYFRYDDTSGALVLEERVTWSPDGFTYEDASGNVTSVEADYQRQIYDKYTVLEDIEWIPISSVGSTEAAGEQADDQTDGQTVPAASEPDLESPYYNITLPEDWGDAEISYHDGYSDDGGFGRGNYAQVLRGGLVVFEVWCFGPNSGTQGDYSFVQVGSPSALADQGIHVDVIVPNRDASGNRDDAGAQARAAEYATYVTLL